MPEESKDMTLLIELAKDTNRRIKTLEEHAKRTDARLLSIEGLLGSFHSSINWQGEALDELRGRVEAVETRHQ